MSLTYDDLDAALTDACKDRDAIAADLRAAREEVERLRGELAEAQATLDNERGEGEPPEPGWRWTDCAGWGWAWVFGATSPDAWVAVGRKPGSGWYVRLGSAYIGAYRQVAVSYQTARAAMRASAKAVRGES